MIRFPFPGDSNREFRVGVSDSQGFYIAVYRISDAYTNFILYSHTGQEADTAFTGTASLATSADIWDKRHFNWTEKTTTPTYLVGFQNTTDSTNMYLFKPSTIK